MVSRPTSGRFSSWLALHEPIERAPLTQRSAVALALVLYAGIFGPAVYLAVAAGFGGNHRQMPTQSMAYVVVAVVCMAVTGVVAGVAIIRGLAGTWAPVTGGGKTTWRTEVVAGSVCVSLMLVAGLLLPLLPHHGFQEATTSAGRVEDVIGFLRTGPLEEICALLAPLVILRAGRVPWPVVFSLLIAMRLLYHLYYGPGAVFLALWAFGATIVYLWARSIIGIAIAHSVYDLTALPSEFGHPAAAGLVRLLFVLGCFLVCIRALRTARRQRAQVVNTSKAVT